MPSYNGARLTPDAAKRSAFAERSLTRTRSFAAGVSGMVVSLYFGSAAGMAFPYPRESYGIRRSLRESFHHRRELVDVERLLDHGTHHCKIELGSLARPNRGTHDHRNGAVLRRKVREHGTAVDERHHEVENDAAEVIARIDDVDRLAATCRSDGAEAGANHHGGEKAAGRCVVVDDQNRLRHDVEASQYRSHALVQNDVCAALLQRANES